MSILSERPAVTRLPLTPLGPGFGAEIHGIDLGRLDDDQVLALREALVAYKVLFVRGQHTLDDAAQIEFGRRLGEVTVGHPVHDSGDVAPEVYSLDSQDNGFADVWHTDVTFVRRPPAISVLRAVVLPPTGGDTNWADSQLAYESLSPGLRAYVDTLTAVHDGSREFGYYLAQRRQGRGNLWDGEVFTELTPTEHPVVRVHPESGRKGLFVNPGFTSHIVGVSEHESRGILDILYAHLTKPEHVVRNRWQPGDVALWDNRGTAHYANRDYGDQHRVMHRITLRGDSPVGPAPSGRSVTPR
ncbi:MULTISPECIES: TauD/TfdA family dioxygenase [Streptomyces]|uniref:TauD/TfdA family dioxygenase n=1 Tax=Streptomyces koelreuteriae TaxID=2838015 RepID=A0ABX8FJ70_9ACTN|nr:MULTISPECIES: TauD/TfdA family dioxygenase [Streptomyces]QWB21167.1 TauD/TfdA family dioxygenase [Streptomyces koelreuteriae]UUA04082.1 TauD/TfdA family dioxygenase [Streptomyces koelreuteriae]UUA11708.1 TauD/TfdA family dioxygenase [Streptomyces sp. CRCS-T-1]